MYCLFGWSCIAAHAYSWRVHYRQKHLFATLMLFGTCIAQPSRAFVDTLGADLGGGFAAYLAGDQRRFISGEDLDGFPLCFSFTFCHHLQAQFCGCAVIVLVEKLLSRTQNGACLYAHALIAKLRVWMGGVGDP